MEEERKENRLGVLGELKRPEEKVRIRYARFARLGE